MSSTATVHNPREFAERLSNYVVYNMNQDANEPGVYAIIASAERAYFEDAHRRMVAEMPDLANAGFGHPFSDMQEAAMSWASAAYDAGVRHGAAIEALRRELVSSEKPE